MGIENTQTNIAENNKRIAKNTLMLYIRMFLMMGVTLFTSRVILQVLGVEDYGIYNVVGGIISIVAFINGGMVSATQRYITFALGKSDIKQLKEVFSTSLQIHIFISLIVLILGETIGLWFLYNELVIPESRMIAALWVLQCSIVTTVVSIMSVPYNAVIIAHEKMSAFACISIFEAFLNLAIVFLLKVSSYDKLIIYAILLLLVKVTIRLIYVRYCNRHFVESKYHQVINKPLLKEMFGFAGWSFWGNLANVLYTQGLNMMLNIFFGPVVNAARGIAVQVQTAVGLFVTNFQVALNPQITKSYAIGDLEQMHQLMFRSARFSFFLLYLLVLPILLDTNFVLTVWLKEVPKNAVVFTQLMLCISLIYSLTGNCVIANQATGKVKTYQAIVGGILLLVLPLSYVVLKMGAPAYSVFIVHFVVELIAQSARIILLQKPIDLPIKNHFIYVYKYVFIVILVSSILPYYIHLQFEEGWLRFIMVGITCVLSVGLSVFFLGLTTRERKFFSEKVFQFLEIKR